MQQDEVDKIIADAVAGNKKQSKWNRPKKKGEGMQRARQILNTLFLLGFLAVIIIYFAYPDSAEEKKVIFYSVGFGTLLLKIVDYVLRFMF